MKRRSFLCLLLAVLLGLTACTPAAEESGAPSSADSDALSGEASAPEESGPTTEPFEPVYRTVVSRGKPYTGPTAVDSYPDTYGSELTGCTRRATSAIPTRAGRITASPTR